MTQPCLNLERILHAKKNKVKSYIQVD